MGRTKRPATYSRYFALGMQLSPALQSPFSFHLGCGYARKIVDLSLFSKLRPPHEGIRQATVNYIGYQC